MMGERAFTKIQYGKETTHGTSVAATRMLLAAPIQVRPDRTPHRPADLSGLRARSTRSVVYEYLLRNTLNFDAEHPAYFQALPLLFSCGLRGGVTPSEVTPSQGDYRWTFTPSLTAGNAPDSITLEVGDDVQAFEAEYLMFERLRISGSVNQDGGEAPVQISADFFARQWTASTFTPALSLPAAETMNAALAQLYLDTTWAGVGGTVQSGLLRSFDIEILTGVHPKFHGSAGRTFNTHGESYIDAMVNLTLEGSSAADAIWDAFMTQSLAVLRIKITGSQIGTGVSHSLTVDIGGTWENVTPLGGEERGNNLHTAMLRGQYDATGAKLLQVVVDTSVSTI